MNRLGYYLNLVLSTIRALNRKDGIYTIPGKADEGKEEDNEGPFVDADCSEDDEGGLDVDCIVDDEAWLDATEGENMDVGDAVCPWQLPLLTKTSSIAKSPV